MADVEVATDFTVDGFEGCSGDMYASMIAQFSVAQTQTLCAALSADGFMTNSGDDYLGLKEGLNCLYLVLCAALVFIMHAGFAMVGCGALI